MSLSPPPPFESPVSLICTPQWPPLRKEFVQESGIDSKHSLTCATLDHTHTLSTMTFGESYHKRAGGRCTYPTEAYYGVRENNIGHHKNS